MNARGPPGTPVPSRSLCRNAKAQALNAATVAARLCSTEASMTAAATPTREQVPPVPKARLGDWNDRIIAGLLDAGVLLLLGLAGGLAAGAYLPPVGWTKLVGLVLGVAYLGLGGSRLSGGQTAGMTVATLTLVGADGRPLSVPRSMLRATVLIAPWCLSMFYLGVTQIPTGPVLEWVSWVLTFGVVPVSAMMLLARPRRGQFFHDVLVGSFLVPEEDVGKPMPPVLGLRALILPALWLFGAGIAGLPHFFHAEIQEQTEIWTRLRALPGVAGVQMVGKLTANNEKRFVVFLGVWTDAPPCADVLRGAAEAMEREELSSGRLDALTLVCVRGWNNGLLHWLTAERATRAAPARQ